MTDLIDLLTSSAPLEKSVGLAAARGVRFIGVVGPSAGWLPETAFSRGVSAVAGMKITDVDQVRQVVLEGGGTPQFAPYGKKYTLVKIP